LVAREQSAEQAYRDLKVFDVNVAVEGKLVDDKRPGLRRFGIEIHQDERVKCIDWRHQKRLPVPVMRGFTQRPQSIVAPRVTLVTIPGVQKFGSNMIGDLPCMHLVA